MGFFSSLTKAALETALLPVDVVKDVATMGGAVTDQSKPYTLQRLENIDDDIESALDSLD